MMRLSRLTDYSIVLLSQMAAEDKTIFAASDLAERTHLPLPTTSKILKQLTRSGILTAHRGATGGYALVARAADITVAAIIEAMDGPIAITDCTDVHAESHVCNIETICPMRANWNKVNRAVRAALQEVSLADMLNGNVPIAAAEPISLSSMARS